MADRAGLVRRARDLVPRIRKLARRTETLRRIPEETIQALHATGAIRAAQPERYGGLGLPFDVVFDVAAELGRGCGSTAWCYSIWASRNWLAGMFPEQAQEDYWTSGCDTLSSTSLNPARGRVEQVQGGYRVSGKWDFASGVDAADWMLIVGNCGDVALMLMLPKTDYKVQDTWFVSGLLGTGSKDVVLNDVFIPEYRTMPMQDMRDALTPGRTFHDTANYRIPLHSILPFTLASPVLGIAQGSLEAFERARQGSESPAIQMRLAESAAEIAAARALMQADTREIFAKAEREEMPTVGGRISSAAPRPAHEYGAAFSVDDRVRYRRDQVYVSRLAVRAVDRLFEASGGHSIFATEALQRFHRDIHAATHHASLAWDGVAEQYGRVRLGLDPSSVDL